MHFLRINNPAWILYWRFRELTHSSFILRLCCHHFWRVPFWRRGDIHLTKGTLSSWRDSLLKVSRDQDYPILYFVDAESYKLDDNMRVLWLSRQPDLPYFYRACKFWLIHQVSLECKALLNTQNSIFTFPLASGTTTIPANYPVSLCNL